MTDIHTELILVRHGETDWNRQHRFQGQIDVPLNATGLEQAERLARRLAGERADVLLSSDLGRARQTAQPLARAWGLPVMDEPGVREQAFGMLEGLDFPTIQREHPQLLAQWMRHRADFALPDGGESQGAFYRRVDAAVQRIDQGLACHGASRCLSPAARRRAKPAAHSSTADCSVRCAARLLSMWSSMGRCRYSTLATNGSPANASRNCSA